MKASEIVQGGIYVAKVSNQLTRVRVDSIESVRSFAARRDYSGNSQFVDKTRYCVTNLTTGRTTVFRSAAKFRRPVTTSV